MAGKFNRRSWRSLRHCLLKRDCSWSTTPSARSRSEPPMSLASPFRALFAMVGFGNDLSYCYSAHPALSTIPFPGFEIGQVAARVLHRQMLGEADDSVLTIPVSEVVQRDSSDVLAIPDEQVCELVRYIRLMAPRDPIRVSELTQISSLSLTTMKARFAHYLGRSPKRRSSGCAFGI